ncbi:ABC transporter substrate-binding protein [Oceanidesulfovibrio indonesiensis]|uniref:ABC transporter substrate-binding protein n=1 Tax=Oceanidesulfovibrio indonesiensis TaxID=54767 RepID=A0A7M3MDV0_9BACT|nr:ABC transporter substrate-binding protein [Oceanidesulfovibrio indonesiensis]TVM16876.1 ABC transporter substrate-binding protein [Oceanidesulfovibrio indonesiensis]
MRNFFIAFFIACAALAPLTVFAQTSIVDDAGREVTLDQPADRVIGLYGAFNEIIAGMGLMDLLVARTRADHEPPEIAALPSIGTHMRPNVELIVSLRPDVVFQMAGRRAGAEEAVAALSARGITVAIFDIHDFEGLFSAIERIGVLLGAEQAAAGLVESMRERLDNVAQAIAGHTNHPSVFYEVRYPNLLAVGSGSMVHDVIRAAGGLNCVDSGRKLVRLSEEELLRLDPNVYLVQQGPMNPNPLPPGERPHFRTLAAIKSGRVHMVDEKMFSRPGPRSVDAVEELAAILYPQSFKNTGEAP